jgi:uncharacterized protein (DUF302 family)
MKKSLIKREEMMSYYFSKMIDLSFDDAVQKVTEELKKEGFGVLTEIDVQATLKKKLDVEFRNYKIADLDKMIVTRTAQIR